MPQQHIPTDDIQRHALAREAIDRRWHLRDWNEIADEVNLTPEALTELKACGEYTDQVWASFGRASHCFSKHRTREDCITHISKFYGVSEELADRMLGKLHKEPEPNHVQLFINLTQ